MNDRDLTQPLSRSIDQPQEPDMSTVTHAEESPTSPMTDDEVVSGGRHPVNVTQLVMAVAFCGMLSIWALWVGEVVSGDDFRWLLPIPWLAAGAAGLAASVLPSRK